MNKVYRLSGFTKVVFIVSILLVLFFGWVFVDACIDSAKADNGYVGIIVMGIILLCFLALWFFGIIELNDSIILTEEGIKFHIHRQTFARPYSLKAIDDEVLWKDIKDASFDRRDNTTFLVLELVSGEVKEFGIGHIEKRVMVDIESRLSPQRYDTQPAAIAAGCFRHTADTSSLVDDVWREQTSGPSGPTAVSHSFARTPREGTEIAPAPGRRNLALTHIPLSPSSRTLPPPCGHLERLFLCAKGRFRALAHRNHR